jgi:hypothetical protein
LFNNTYFDLNMTITMAGVEYFQPDFGAEKPASVTASRRRGSPGENIARGHPDSVLFFTGSPHAFCVRDDKPFPCVKFLLELRIPCP